MRQTGRALCLLLIACALLSTAASAQSPASQGLSFVVTAGGDCTLGVREGWEENPAAFNMRAEGLGLGAPLAGLAAAFAQDDLTIINLEGPLTESTAKEKRALHFRGKPGYARILSEGSVEAVNLANNHMLDYGEQGLEDTLREVARVDVLAFGRGLTAIYEKNGVRVGLIGRSYPFPKAGADISAQVDKLREQGCHIVLASFHWGSEYEAAFTAEQRRIGRAAIKAGADAVLGHHPHVIQGIEKYEGRYILYSLGSLIPGGVLDTKDKDSFLAQLTFTIDPSATGQQAPPQLDILPVRLTAQTKGLDYCPVLPEAHEADRILKKIEQKSYKLYE